MKNIVWLVSYPKSGNTWFRMFLANYLKNASEPLPLNEIETTRIASSAVDFEDLIALNPFELTPDEADLYRPDMYRIISKETEKSGDISYKKVHDAYTLNKNKAPLFPEDITKCAIYFVRNPLDVCVSYANHSSSNIEETLKFLLDEKANLSEVKSGQLRQMLFSWKSHIKSWQEQSLIPVHFVRYEDMQQTPVESFGAIINFLQLDYNEELLQKAIIYSDFKLLQKMEKEYGFNEKPQFSKSFFRSGTIGNYRKHLSEEQIQRIVEYNYDMMKLWGYLDEHGNLTV